MVGSGSSSSAPLEPSVAVKVESLDQKLQLPEAQKQALFVPLLMLVAFRMICVLFSYQISPWGF